MTSVLLAEDDERIRAIYAFALEHEGFEVAMASSGAEALSWVEQRQFDVILLDMLMSGMSGLDFLRAYDVKTHCPQTKVIALTNFDSPQIVAKAQKLGVTQYLTKADYEPKEIVEYIRKLVAT